MKAKVKITLNPAYQGLRSFVEELPERFEREGETIYNARNQIRLIEHNGLKINVKRFHCPALPNRLVYSILRTPKAVRAYQNAVRLLAMGIPTPEPIAYILCGGHLLAESYLVTVQSPLSRNFYEFRHHPLQGYESIVRQFARFTASVHQHGVLHLDYSPGNILFDIDAAGQAQFLLVDINRMRFNKRQIGLHAACKNFCRLWGNQDFFELLADEYATARGWDKATTRRLILHYWKQFWKHRK